MREKPLFYSGCALIVGGALAFAVYGYFHLEMLRVQRAASRLIDEQKTRHAASLHTRDVPPALVIVPPRVGEPVGRIEIPRLHISVIVLEGTAPRILRVAAGYIHGTALLGTTGNIGVAAHRDTFFRPLRDVRQQDAILITTSYGTFRYAVDAIEIVNPNDVQVLHRTAGPELTLVTCYPFTYLGAAPKRFVIHARQQVWVAPDVAHVIGDGKERLRR
jgi:sortase A